MTRMEKRKVIEASLYEFGERNNLTVTKMLNPVNLSEYLLFERRDNPNTCRCNVNEFDYLYTDPSDIISMLERNILIRLGLMEDPCLTETYQQLAARTINKDLSDFEKIDHALKGMIGEIGEINSIYQKVYQGHQLDKEHLKKELGDLLWFIAEYCTANGWKMEDIMDMNIQKLKERYPNGFEAVRSLHRDKNDI